MRRVFASAGFVILFSSCAFGQTAPKSPVFEAADVHGTRPRLYTNFRSNSYLTTVFAGGIYELHIASMADLIRTAYGIDTNAIPNQSSSEHLFGGPSWLETERFELVAKAPPDSTPADLRLMLQALLADRFKLVVHKADKPTDVFVLSGGKKLLMKVSQNSEDPGCKPVWPANGPPRYLEVNCQAVTMADFMHTIRQCARTYVKYPMVDLTKLDGSYDFSLKWTPWGMMPPGEEDAVPYISFFDAVDKQLGLKLEAGKLPMPVLVIDSVNRTPTANAPGVAKLLPVTDEFEVASVKPSRPDDKDRRIRGMPGGRFEVENVPLKTLMALAWNMEEEENLILDAPKWIESVKLDIVAKAAGPQSPRPLPVIDFQVMLQTLLKERFKITAHTEDRPIPVWTLVLGKRGLKLQAGDPGGRSKRFRPLASRRAKGWVEGSPIRQSRMPECDHGTTGGHVAWRLQSLCRSPGCRQNRVERRLHFHAYLQPHKCGGSSSKPQPDTPLTAEGQNDNALPNASPPLEALSMFEALEKVGLHLESGQKHPEPILVIDHMEPLVPDN